MPQLPLSNEQFLEIAARERTFDLAYTRSSLGMLATGIFIYRIFQKPFLPIAIVFVILGLCYYLVVIWRRYFYFRSVPKVHPEEEVFEMTAMKVEGGENKEGSSDEGGARERVTVSRGSSMPNVRVEELAGSVSLKVTVPMIPPHNRAVGEKGLHFYQTSSVFVTSGGVVAVTAVVTAVAEILCLVFILGMNF